MSNDAREWLRLYHGDDIDALPNQEMPISLLVEYLESFAASRLAGAEQRIAELERERDSWRRTAERLESEKVTAESLLAEARTALERITTFSVTHFQHYSLGTPDKYGHHHEIPHTHFTGLMSCVEYAASLLSGLKGERA